MNQRLLLAIPAWIAAVAPLTAFAAAPESLPRGTVPFRSIVSATTPEQAGAASVWKAFEERHGRWSAEWNRRTGSPHRALGEAIDLPGFADDAASVERAVRGFVSSEPGLFGRPQLERIAMLRVDGRWVARFRQVVDGMPVLFTDWEFRAGANGRLSMFGADAIRTPLVEDASAPRIGAAVARAAATQGIDFDPARDEVTGGEPLALLPIAAEAGLTLRRVLEVHVDTAEPPGRWIVLVDAVTGEIRARVNRVRTAISGQVTGQVHPALPTDPLTALPLRDAYVTVGATTVVTDASGNYTAPAAGTVTVSTQFRGPFADVNRQDLVADASQSASVADPATRNFAWTSGNSHDAERDAFYHVNRVHNYLKTLDPSFTGLDFIMPVNVNINQTCNAFWDGSSLNFFLAGGGCVNTATIGNVAYHEYGHAINDYVYLAAGSPNGMVNGALHEGMADVNAAMLEDQPLIGRGFTGPGSYLRNLDNTNQWPADDGEVHFAGQMIGGAFWDLRQAVGNAVAAHDAHFAKYGAPDDFDNGEAMHEFFVETLVADDDDANLANGTPHSTDIINAFNLHGIGTGFFVDITHTPLADDPGHGPYLVQANIVYSGPIGSLNTSSPTLFYSVNNGGWNSVLMQPSGTPNVFRASLPPQFVGVIRYYMSAADNFGQTFTSPRAAPARGVYTFLAGPVTPQLTQDMETNPGWTVGGPDDNAVTGVWVRTNPNGTYVDADPSQPEDDHTPGPGVQCWITGNGAPGGAPGDADVDGGQTTLTTNTFNATGFSMPVIEFYRWYRNDLGGDPNRDTLHVSISNDGGTNWSVLENDMASAGDWVRKLYRIEDFITPTANMKLRFRAADFGSGSLVEAGIDDFRLLGVSPSVDVAPGAGPAALQLSAAPNPFGRSSTIQWRMPEAADVSLDVYDAAGRRVRVVAAGRMDAGDHSEAWDGRDESGRSVGAGLYWLRLRAGGREIRSSIVRLR